MSYRFRKQTAISFVYFLILALIGFGVYLSYFRAAATCSDNKQNQDETGVDCGGSCISCERLTIKQPEVISAEAILLKKGQYDLLGQVVNPNPNFGLADLEYVFKLYDFSGNSLGEKKGHVFLLPNQTKYIMEGNASVFQPIGKTELVLTEAPQTDWRQLAADYRSPSIFIYEKQFKLLENEAASAEASGIIKNDSLFDFDRILVTVVLTDKEKKIMGVNKTEARTVLAGEDRYFSCSWFNKLSSEVNSVEMQAETNLFSSENFMRRYGTQEKFQEYETQNSQ